jgi:hypothetical protein
LEERYIYTWQGNTHRIQRTEKAGNPMFKQLISHFVEHTQHTYTFPCKPQIIAFEFAEHFQKLDQEAHQLLSKLIVV